MPITKDNRILYDNHWRFRAYDKKRRCMLSGEELAGYNLHIGSDGWITFPDRLILMQQLWVKDKNGLFVFEGDVVGYTSQEHIGDDFKVNMKRHGAVTWMPELSGYMLYNPVNQYFSYMESVLASGDMEVMGNVFDTPQILQHGYDPKAQNPKRTAG